MERYPGQELSMGESGLEGSDKIKKSDLVSGLFAWWLVCLWRERGDIVCAYVCVCVCVCVCVWASGFETTSEVLAQGERGRSLLSLILAWEKWPLSRTVKES